MLPARDEAPTSDPFNLLDCGDWACAHCNCGGLADVANRLAHCACDQDRGALKEIERLAAVDMDAASTLWARFTTARRRAKTSVP